MTLELLSQLGRVCERCDEWNAPNAFSCMSCLLPLDDDDIPSIAPSQAPVLEALSPPRTDPPDPPAWLTAPSEDGNRVRCMKCNAEALLTDRFCRTCGHRLTGSAGPVNTLSFAAVPSERIANVVLVRGHKIEGSQWRVSGAAEIGRTEGFIRFPDDAFIAQRHCRLAFRGSELWLEPATTTNGVFLRVKERERVTPGDEIVIGAQRLRVMTDADRAVVLSSGDGTRIIGSLVRSAPAIGIVRLFTETGVHEIFYRHQKTLTIGRHQCDVMFPKDGFVSERHAQITRDDNELILEDLRSRNGTYLRVNEARRMAHGDLVLIGDKVLRIELPR